MPTPICIIRPLGVGIYISTGHLLHYLVLGEENLPDFTKPKQASINAFYICFVVCPLKVCKAGIAHPHSPARIITGAKVLLFFELCKLFYILGKKISSAYSRLLCKQHRYPDMRFQNPLCTKGRRHLYSALPTPSSKRFGHRSY